MLIATKSNTSGHASDSGAMDSYRQAALEPMFLPDGKALSPNCTNTAPIQAGTSDTKVTSSLGGLCSPSDQPYRLLEGSDRW